MKLIGTLFLLLTLSASALAQEAALTGEVTGHIYLADGKTPASGAQITAFVTETLKTDGSYETHSATVADADAEGSFKVPDVPLGSVSFWVVYPQFAPKVTFLVLSKQKPNADVTVLLKERGGSITGKVLAEHNSPAPVTDFVAFPEEVLLHIGEFHWFDPATQQLFQEWKHVIPGALQATARSDASGHFRLPHLAPGSYVVLIEEANAPLAIRRGVVITDNQETILSFDDKKDFSIIDLVLKDLVQSSDLHGEQNKLVLSKVGYEKFRPKNEHILMGDLNDFNAESKQLKAEYIKINPHADFVVHSWVIHDFEALAKVFPHCRQWVVVDRPTYSSDGTAHVSLSMGPGFHGDAHGTYILILKRGHWSIKKGEVWYPA